MKDPARSLRNLGLARLTLLLPLVAVGCGDDSSQDETSATTTATTATTDPETTGGGDTTGGWVDDCEGIELAQDGVLDLDVPAAEYVVISGQVRLNGETLPDTDAPRGSLRFDYTPTVGAPGSATYVLGDTGAENYTVVVPAGAASVHYVPDEGLCDQTFPAFKRNAVLARVGCIGIVLLSLGAAVVGVATSLLG